MYPQRNRIVAGLSKGTLIIEAGLNSGSLITANYASIFKREVLVVPGSIFSENFEGIYQLIRAGARTVRTAQNISDYCGFGPLGHKFADNTVQQPGLGLEDPCFIDKCIVDLLRHEHLTFDEIYRQVDSSREDLSSTLTLMMLNGVITEEEGIYYAN